jgi:exopolysaccharide biosynthesis polyprenyl glycosylphosphotransferase
MKLRWLTAERAQQVNIAGDCFLLAVAAVMSTVTNESPGINTMVAPALAFAMIFIWATAARVLRHYDLANGRRERGDAVVTLMLVGLGLGAFVLLRALVPPCARATETWRFALVLVPGAIWLRLMTSWMRLRREVPPPKVLIVGVGSLGRHTGHELRGARAPKEVIGYLRFEDDDETPNARLPAPALGTIEDLAKCIKERELDEVYLAGNLGTHHHAMQKAISVCERYGIPFALPAAGFRFDRAVAVGARSTPDGYVHYLSVKHKPFGWAIKRAFDMLSSGIALALLSPLLIGTAIAIKLTSRGPIFFKQVRVGLYGRQFHMLKFRSMVVNAEELRAKLMVQNEQSGPVFKLQRDPRITAVGRFIRKYSVDELPQLINVLRGEMSIVGPRPAIPSEVLQYEAWQRRRLSVRPGLTCVWQVSGRNQIGFEEWMYLDMQYIDHWSLANDFALVLRTVPVVLTGRGAS